MDRATVSRIAHRDHPIAAPVSEARAQVLLSRLSPPAGGRVLDLGCGSGVWLAGLGEWLEGYRGQLGFVFVVLNDARA